MKCGDIHGNTRLADLVLYSLSKAGAGTSRETEDHDLVTFGHAVAHKMEYPLHQELGFSGSGTCNHDLISVGIGQGITPIVGCDPGLPVTHTRIVGLGSHAQLVV